jgi:hypothetical protein
MSATRAIDRVRLRLEEIQALQIEACEHLHAACTLLAQIARTDEEADVLRAMIRAKRAVAKARGLTADAYPESFEERDP